MERKSLDVHFGSLAGMATSPHNVRFTPKSGLSTAVAECPLSAKTDVTTISKADLRERPFLCTGASQSLNASLIGSKFARRSRIDDVSVVQDISMVGDLQAHTSILFDQQDGNVFFPHPRDDSKYLTHDKGRQSLRRLVKNKEFWIEQ